MKLDMCMLYLNHHQENRQFLQRQCFTKESTAFVKTNGAKDSPKGETVNTKYFVAPLITQKMLRYVCWEPKMSI